MKNVRKKLREDARKGVIEIRFYFTNTRRAPYMDHRCKQPKSFRTKEELYHLLKTPNLVARLTRSYYAVYAKLRGVGRPAIRANEWYGGFYGRLPSKARRKYRLRNILIERYI